MYIFKMTFLNNDKKRLLIQFILLVDLFGPNILNRLIKFRRIKKKMQMVLVAFFSYG